MSNLKKVKIKKTKNQIQVNQNGLTKKEQKMILGAGGEGVTYICTKCNFIVTSEGAPPATCPVCGTIGGFAVSGRSST